MNGDHGRGGGARGGNGSNTNPPPPTKTYIKLGAADRTVAKEVGRSRQNDGLGDGDKIFVRPAVKALTVRPSIGAHRTLVRPANPALTGY